MRYQEKLALVRAHFRSIKPFRMQIAHAALARMGELPAGVPIPTATGGQAEQLVALVRACVYGSADMDRVEQELLSLGAAHAKAGLTCEAYITFRRAFLAALAEVLGDAWNQPLHQAWDAALLCAVGMLTRGHLSAAEPDRKAA